MVPFTSRGVIFKAIAIPAFAIVSGACSQSPSFVGRPVVYEIVMKGDRRHRLDVVRSGADRPGRAVASTRIDSRTTVAAQVRSASRTARLARPLFAGSEHAMAAGRTSQSFQPPRSATPAPDGLLARLQLILFLVMPLDLLHVRFRRGWPVMAALTRQAAIRPGLELPIGEARQPAVLYPLLVAAV